MTQANITSIDSNATITYQYTCDFVDPQLAVSFYLMDLINSTLLPFFIMFVSSVVLGVFIFKSRMKMLNLTLEHDRKALQKNIRFCLTILFLNFFFFILNVPVALSNVLGIMFTNPMLYLFFIFVFYFSYSVNFYILAVFNKIFKKELFEFVREFFFVKKRGMKHHNTSSTNAT